MKTTKKTPEVLREFPAVGKYRVRLMSTSEGRTRLDVREYVSTQDFEGFTRRGINLSKEEMVGLRDTINHLLETE